ncbi:META domain-containing protein [Paraburkholderia ferrariae]|uniref:META domain-containing protein n=1 Tax=Paraburkholderia ferrariae TaxID=386056 RepID=UPI000A009369|nr:META domain-containing protein [Paraburkholderia ferrariae]
MPNRSSARLSARPSGRPAPRPPRLRAGLIASRLAPLAAALMLAACKMPVHHDSSAPPPDPYTPAATQLLDNTQWQLVQWKQADGTLRAVPGAADTAAATAGTASSPTAAAPGTPQNARPITLDLSTATGLRRASGFSGCNRYTGTYMLKNGLLSFGPLAGTRMACAGAGGEIEGAYLDALAHIARTGVQMDEPQALLLILEDGDRLTFTHPPADKNAAEPRQ